MAEREGRTRRLRGQTGGSCWDVALRAPDPRLRPYVVGDYCGYTERTPGVTRRREFAAPLVVAVLEFGPPLRVYAGGDPRHCARHPGGFVAGLGSGFAVCEHDGFQQGVQLNLTPVGARLVFGVPLSELAGVTPLRDLLPPRHGGLGERLQDLADWDARFDLLDAALLDCVAAARTDTAVVSWAVRRIQDTAGALAMKSLARELGYSHKHVIALFRDQVGVPPKLLARIV
ncbi:MAG TPA: AraC family transcriptional regulator, partial [Vicinamibacteria bacterium]|nr:AraC family transcriptional regulator [Vicinamibacteria bacterium]